MRKILLPSVAVALAIAALAQRSRFTREPTAKASFPAKAEFHFLRLQYTDLPQYHRRYSFSSRAGMGQGWWMMDWPDAEEHFTHGIRRLTRIETGEPRYVRLTDDRVFDYPWMYATQVGWWDLSDAEVDRLRQYLLKGGFLVVDDFDGPEQWEMFRRTMARALPDSPIRELTGPEPVMHVLYDIEEKDRTFIPGSRHLRRGPGGKIVIEQPEGTEPAWHAMYDDKERMVVAINFNMDVADAWEFADWPEYPEHKTTLAYRFGINYIVYAMTH